MLANRSSFPRNKQHQEASTQEEGLPERGVESSSSGTLRVKQLVFSIEKFRGGTPREAAERARKVAVVIEANSQALTNFLLPRESRLPQPELRAIDPHRFVLEKPYLIEIDGKQLSIPAGFTTDLATTSIPLNRYRLGIPGIHNLAFGAVGPLVHDYLYYRQGKIAPDWDLGRVDADKIMETVMVRDGVPPVHARIARFAGELLGEVFWQRHAESERATYRQIHRAPPQYAVMRAAGRAVTE